MKREDLNHPDVSGNKWWKLKYNLAEASKINQPILTFGGAFSNHIYATAAASAELTLRTIGMIRGEKTLPLNPTLQFAISRGMEIHYMSRAAYRLKSTAEFIQKLHLLYGPFFLIPEGGSNLLAVKGCAEFAERVLSKIDFDHLFLSVGTGGTMAGLISGLKGSKNIIGISVLKGGEFLKADIDKMVLDFSGKPYNNWSLLTQYHLGGYAKSTPELLSFVKQMKSTHDLPLDLVYGAKLLRAVIKEVESGSFKRGTTILVLHTGGLQGGGQELR